MATTSDIKNGMCIDFNFDIWTVVDFQHVKPGKGAAFVRTKIKSLTSGKVLENTFPAGHKIDEVRVERRQCQFLYKTDDGFFFMNTETFEEINLPEALIDAPQFLMDGQMVEVLFHAAKEIPLSCDMPSHVVMTVTYTEPGVRGDTATNTLKPATVESGATVNVPLFVEEGTKIRIDTRTGAYVERVK